MDRVLSWRLIGGIDARALVDARILLHHAAQLVTAPGRSLLPPRADDGQTAFVWIEERQLLAGEWVGGTDHPIRVALDLGAPGLVLIDESGNLVARRELRGDTLDAAFHWLTRSLGARGIDVSRLTRGVPYELPFHAVATGSPFPLASLPGFGELALYFANAHGLLRALVSGTGASPLRCWPHHFDLGTLLGSEANASVGLGLSPGDGAYPEPYFYVTVWPVPPIHDRLPDPAGGGHWHRDGWFGAVLTGTHLTELRDAQAQEARARDFLEGAFGIARDMVGLPHSSEP